jgi:hypothetical protein
MLWRFFLFDETVKVNSPAFSWQSQLIVCGCQLNLLIAMEEIEMFVVLNELNKG